MGKKPATTPLAPGQFVSAQWTLSARFFQANTRFFVFCPPGFCQNQLERPLPGRGAWLCGRQVASSNLSSREAVTARNALQYLPASQAVADDCQECAEHERDVIRTKWFHRADAKLMTRDRDRSAKQRKDTHQVAAEEK